MDELRNDVKRLIVPLQEFTLVADRLRLLDVRVNGPELAAIVDDCESALRLFAIEGVEPKLEDLTLDEIFAAFVTGRDRAARQPHHACDTGRSADDDKPSLSLLTHFHTLPTLPDPIGGRVFRFHLSITISYNVISAAGKTEI